MCIPYVISFSSIPMNQQEKILDQLLMDPRFREWIHDGQHQNYWTKWQEEHPLDQEVFQDAVAIVRGLPVQKIEVTSDEIERSFLNLENKAQKQTDIPQKSGWQVQRWLPYAAALVAVLVSVYIWNPMGSGGPEIEMTVSTAPGKKKEVVLPDSSVVVLNGNSLLHYFQKDLSGERVVTLDGEAHFNVKTREGDKGRLPFVVNTPDLTVAVLGTVFSVGSDSIWTTIVLEEGKIKWLAGSNASAHKDGLLMRPGEKTKFHNIHKTHTVEEIDAIEYNSWTQNDLSLENRSAGEVVRWMKRNYNYQIQLPEQYLDSSLTGSVSLEDPQVAIQVVALALGLESVKISEKKWDFKKTKTNE